jgi:Bifunctional DNA primase/polymerase, N-terminal
VNPVAEWALLYAEHGFVVMPLEPKKAEPHKRMLGKFKETGGFDTVGSTDSVVIESWWRQDPAANLGVVGGARSGRIALDLDVKNGKDGIGSLQEWEHFEAPEPLPRGPMVATPSGGLHLWYELPEGRDLRKRDGWLPGVDVRGARGLVVVPPSVRDAKRHDRYASWVELAQYHPTTVDEPGATIPDPWPWFEEMPIAPDWLLRDIESRPRPARGGGINGAWSGGLPSTEELVGSGLEVGRRNDDCFALACRLWRQYDDETTVVGIMFRVWQQTPQNPAPFTWDEALACVASAERATSGQTRGWAR